MRRVAIGLLALTIALGTPGCGDGLPPKEEPTPTVAPTATPTLTPTVAPPVSFTPTCDSIVMPATLAGFTSDGVSVTPQATFVAKLKSEGQWFELPADSERVDRVHLVLTSGVLIVGGTRDRVEEILAITQ